MVLVVLMVFSAIVSRILVRALSLTGFVINPIIETTIGVVLGIIVFFGVVPYVQGLPQRRTSVTRYLNIIGVRRPQSISNLMTVTLPCITILFSSWLLASLVYARYQLFLGGNLAFFIGQLVDISSALPPQNWSIVTAINSIFEEVVMRGIFMIMLLDKHTECASIGLSALA